MPIVIAGSVTGVADARATYERVLGDVPALLERNVEHYRAPRRAARSTSTRPTTALERAFAGPRSASTRAWLTNPLLGTGLVAGFRTSGDSERPGFRLVLRAGRHLDDVRDQRLRRFRHHAGRRSSSFAASSATTARSRTRSRRARRSFHGSRSIRTRGPAPTRRRCTSRPTRTTGAHAATQTSSATAWPSHREGVAVLRGDRHGRQRPDREHRGRARLGRRRRALSAARGNLSAGRLDRRTRRAWRELASRRHGRRRHGRRRRAARERARQSTESTYWLGDRQAYAYATKLPRTDSVLAEPGPARERRQARTRRDRGRTALR